MKLTKQQAIKEHRKMWNWIADYYTSLIGKEVENINYMYFIEFVKKRYLTEQGIENLKCRCFCCEYTSKSDCDNCPLKWIDIEGNAVSRCIGEMGVEDGLHNVLCELSEQAYVDFKECARISRIIANLEEKVDETN